MKKQALILLTGTVLLVGPLLAQSSDESPRRRVVGFEEAASYRVAVFGDELRPERVPANANFVLYFDLENFKRTSLWKLALQNRDQLELEDGLEELQEFKREFGIDPLTDVKSVLVYGNRGDDKPSAVQVVTNDRIDQAIGALRQREGYKALDHEGYIIHSFADGSNDRVHAYVQELRGGDRVLVFAEDVEAVHESAMVLNGEAKSLLGSDSVLKLTATPGSFLHVSAVDIPGLDDFEPASQVFGLAQGFQFDFGEAGGSLFAHMMVATDSPDTAMDIVDTVQGLLALARMAMRDESAIPVEARELMRALQVSARGSSVTVDFEYSSTGLLELLKKVDGQDLGW